MSEHFVPCVLVWKGKHDNVYIDASTVEKRESAMKALFLFFDEEEYFYDLKDPKYLEEARIDAEEEKVFIKKLESGGFDDLPEYTLQDLKERYKHKHSDRQYRSMCRRVYSYRAATGSEEPVLFHGKPAFPDISKPVKAMMDLLYEHQDGEYEHWSFEHLYDPDEQIEKINKRQEEG